MNQLRFLGYLALLLALLGVPSTAAQTNHPQKVFVVPVQADIMPPLVYVIRRGVKEAISANATLIVLEMDTNGGRLDTTEEIIKILGQFKGPIVTYVNRKAFSAGAFIAVATSKIYMAPQSVIGAAAPMLLIPGGGPAQVPETVEAKMTSAVRALVRANAEKNGYNVEVIEAMIDKTRKFEIDGEVLNEKGQILTLTNVQAEKEYGKPPRRLLSSGTVNSVSELLDRLGYANAETVRIQETGVEKFGAWINALSPILLVIGLLGLYLEFKTPGFGLPGIVGISAFAIYFLGGFVAGLSGMEWLALFIVGLVLFILEVLVFPGTVALGLLGGALILISIVMAMVDIYPAYPVVPNLPNVPSRFAVPLDRILTTLSITGISAAICVWALSRILPKTSLYASMVSATASGEATILSLARTEEARMGLEGETISDLRPGGKVRFGDEIVDAVSEGQLIPKKRRVRVVGSTGGQPVVQSLD